MLLTDLHTIPQRDRVARNWLEILFCYPGVQAFGRKVGNAAT